MQVNGVGSLTTVTREEEDSLKNASPSESIQEKGRDLCERLKNLCPTGNIGPGCGSGCNVFGTNGVDYWEKDQREKGPVTLRPKEQAEEEKKEPLHVHKGGCECTITLQDESDDPTVSFQTPTKVPKSRSTAAVIAHENEHVANERARAAKEGRRVVITVNIDYETCPECGMRYAVGGVTRVRTVGTSKSQAVEGASQETEDQEPTDTQVPTPEDVPQEPEEEDEQNPLIINKKKVNDPAEMTPELEQKIVQLKKLRPDMDPQELETWLRQQEGIDVSEMEIKRILKKHGLAEDSEGLRPSLGARLDLIA